MRMVTGAQEALVRVGVAFISRQLTSTAPEKGILGVPGGRSVKGLLRGLADAQIEWPRIHIFLADERCVPLTDPESNYQEVYTTLGKPLVSQERMPAENLHPCTGTADEYARTFHSLADHFDALVLGAGEDGHIASLFPGHPGLRDESDLFIDVGNSPKPPPQRVSASMSLIRRSNAIVLLFLGASKRNALGRFLDPLTTVEDCPAKLAAECPNLLVLTDQTPE